MSNSNIKKRPLLSEDRLDLNQYTLSLLDEAFSAGLMDKDSLDSIQAQLMSLLGDLILRYTKGKSTSLKAETAEGLLQSIIYSIDAYLKNLDDPEAALGLLIAGNIEDVYEKGLALIDSTFVETRSLYEEIAKNKLSVSNQAYQATIDEALPGFFGNYDMVFKAQDTIASMDYPLLFDDMRISGIYYIKQYLEKLKLENQFCSLFTPHDTEKLLLNYGRVYFIDYQEALINLFEILLTNSIFSVLSGQSSDQLSISSEQYELLLHRLQALNHDQCSSLIKEAIETLLKDFHIEQPQLKKYIRNFQAVLMPRFLNALDHNNLSSVVVQDARGKFSGEIIYEEGRRLDDESFREMFDEIMECDDTSGKIEIISTKIHSFSDFIDLLEADCLFGEEYSSLFSTLGDIELSILARTVFAEEIRSDFSEFSLADAVERARNAEWEWQTELAKYLRGLSEERTDSIDNLIKFPL